MVTRLWRKVKSVTAVMQKMSHARRIYVVKVVMEIMAAHVYREKLAGRLNTIFLQF